MIRTSETITKISQALFAFQGEVDGVGKNKVNPAFKSQYATLEAVMQTAKPSLQAHGLVFLQSPGAVEDGSLSISTRLIHVESGEWVEGTMQVPLGKKDPQGAGSATTYGLRYSLMAMLGMPAVDDDGEGAMDREVKKAPPKPKDAPPATEIDYVDKLAKAMTLDDARGVLELAWKSTTVLDKRAAFKSAYEAKKAELATPNFEGLE